jgi:transposase
MGEVSTIGLDIAKSVFQIHGVDAGGAVVLRKRFTRAKLLEFFAALPACLVGIEACPTAHHWSRRLQVLGHRVRLLPPSYVKAYLKRSKNDANDAAAICEAVTRPSMRFVATKSEQQQSGLMLHRSRQLLVCQRTMLSNAIRGHLAELGIISAKGRNGTAELLEIIADEQDDRIPPAARQPRHPCSPICGYQGRDRGDREAHPCLAPLECREPAAGGNPWRWPDRRYRAGGRGRRLEDVLVGPQPCCMDRLGAETAFDRGQRETGQDLEAGQSTFALAARRRRHGRDPICATTRHETALARSSDGASADQGRCRCACQQDRTHGLGHDGARRAVQGTEVAAGGIGVNRRQKVIGNWRGHNDVMQTRSFRGSGEPAWVNASWNACFRLGPDPRRALGPAAIRAASTGRTHDRTRPMLHQRKKALVNQAPSTHDPKRT